MAEELIDYDEEQAETTEKETAEKQVKKVRDFACVPLETEDSKETKKKSGGFHRPSFFFPRTLSPPFSPPRKEGQTNFIFYIFSSKHITSTFSRLRLDDAARW